MYIVEMVVLDLLSVVKVCLVVFWWVDCLVSVLVRVVFNCVVSVLVVVSLFLVLLILEVIFKVDSLWFDLLLI